MHTRTLWPDLIPTYYHAVGCKITEGSYLGILKVPKNIQVTQNSSPVFQSSEQWQLKLHMTRFCVIPYNLVQPIEKSGTVGYS